MPLRTAVFDQIIRSSWRRMIHLWRPMAVWTILVWAFGIFIFGPITSAILGWSIFRGERLVVSNEELLNWFVTPVGITYLLFSIVVILTITVLRFAGIFQIVRNDMEGKPAAIQQVILRIAAHMPSILKLCAFTAVCLIILLIPLITGYIFIYHIFLGDHDINYYLLTQPAEWYYSIYSAGFYTLVWFIVFAWITGRSLLALPAYLDGHKGIRTALKCSWKLANNRTIRLLKVMTFSIIIWFFVRFSVDAFFLFSATFILEQLTGFTMSLRPVLIVTGAYISGSQLLSSIIGFTGFSFISTVLVKFYFEDTNLHQQASDPPGVAKLSNKVKKLLNYWVKPARLFLLIFFLLIASYASSRLLIDQLPKPDTVLVVAHRAGPPPAPENTLSALERGILAGAEIIEIDVQRTRDDIVVVVHDADLMRVAGDPKRISETNYIDIKEVVQLPDDGTPPGLRK
ncbi:MAG: glycerophosphodiester phosphodiesterase family protein, partial [Balneolaceae bacterium]